MTEPADPPPIVTVATVEVFRSQFGRLFNDETVGPTGRPGRYLRWEWTGTGVVVVPIYEHRYGLWSMYRYPVGRASLEFPRGSVDDRESVEHAALRELREETGLIGLHPRRLGVIHAETGLIASSVAVVTVQVVSPTASQSAAEPMESVAEHGLWLTDHEVRDLMTVGQLTCGITIAAWTLHWNYLHG